MRGEDVAKLVGVDLDVGSPPHARGRLSSTFVDDDGKGITPACAGKTWRCGRGFQAAADHPRMRGEDSPLYNKGRVEMGSPPHARGRLPTSRAVRIAERITPACAGKTIPSFRLATLRRDHPRMRGED